MGTSGYKKNRHTLSDCIQMWFSGHHHNSTRRQTHLSVPILIENLVNDPAKTPFRLLLHFPQDFPVEAKNGAKDQRQFTPFQPSRKW